MSTTVNATQSASGASGASTSQQTSKIGVDYNSFLRLLVAEMKNQDPTDPMDSTQYIAQLASFSQVEQSVQINEKLDQMLQSSALSQADALIGRSVTSADGETTGIVSEVRLISNGVVAVLESGEEIEIDAGVTISAAGQAAADGTAAADETTADQTTADQTTADQTAADQTDE